MTTIAWDGNTLAADKQNTSHGLPRTTTKIYRVRGELIALTGGTHCYALLEWFKGPREPKEWPRGSNDDDCGNVIRICRDGIFVYNGAGFPHAEPLEDKFMAFGSGRDFAIAAMHMGATAKEAVEIASIYDINTGMGVDTLDLT